MNKTPKKHLRIVFIGPEYHGGDSGGLARALRRQGHVIMHIDPDRISPYFSSGFWGKVVNRISYRLVVRELEKEILIKVPNFAPHFALVFKGNFVSPGVLKSLKQRNIYLMNFYPDTDYFGHGPLIPQSLPLYDHIFSTKSFGAADLKKTFNITNCEFLSHGYNPELHRPFPITKDDIAVIGADASFIGTWSPQKASYLSHLAKSIPGLHLRIWGSLWERAEQAILRPYIMGVTVVGDVYPLAIQCTKINIALLIETRKGISKQDLVTTRTFHIPASGGFMLHQRTDELLQYFKEDMEVACFSTPEEMVDKVKYYLEHEDERERIRIAGHRRCVAENSIDNQAKRIVEHYLAYEAKKMKS